MRNESYLWNDKLVECVSMAVHRGNLIGSPWVSVAQIRVHFSALAFIRRQRRKYSLEYNVRSL